MALFCICLQMWIGHCSATKLLTFQRLKLSKNRKRAALDNILKGNPVRAVNSFENRMAFDHHMWYIFRGSLHACITCVWSFETAYQWYELRWYAKCGKTIHKSMLWQDKNNLQIENVIQSNDKDKGHFQWQWLNILTKRVKEMYTAKPQTGQKKERIFNMLNDFTSAVKYEAL